MYVLTRQPNSGLVHNLRRLGAEVQFDPADRTGFEIGGDGPPAADMEAAFKATYDWYRLPPDEWRPMRIPAIRISA
jgi:hypothetical protein